VEVSPEVARAGVEVHLETSLGPNEFALLLERVPRAVLANYDSGNSASLGYDVAEEFAAYGSRVGSVHIKDRVRGGGTVPLGSGSADLPALFDALDRVGYQGMYTLQVARSQTGDEVAWARHNRARVLKYLEQSRRS
jgi:L-ribulose-5-phosphate 3-epimerase